MTKLSRLSKHGIKLKKLQQQAEIPLCRNLKNTRGKVYQIKSKEKVYVLSHDEESRYED